jgi:hypothetical protein
MQHVFGSMLRTLHAYVVAFPMRYVYQNGAGTSIIGCWSGAGNAEICAALTGTPASHWVVHDAICDNLIMDRVNSWLVLIWGSMYVYAIFSVITTTAVYCVLRCKQRILI